MLAVFKYANFVSDNLAYLFERPLWHVNIALPLGISFFTFHHIMYLVDLRRGKAPEYSLGRYALYISFFPQAIAGPLARWSEVMHQFGRQVYAPGWQRQFAIGVTFIVIGLIEKTWLGDPIGRLLDPIYAQAKQGPVTGGDSWLALGFGFQVLFDFAGYSDIAIGVGLLFGVQLPYNFNAPLRSTNLQDFWQRWHMTLMLFLRDYVFVPLSNVKIGRTAPSAGPALRRDADHDGAVRPVARRELDLRAVGHAARVRAGDRVAVAPARSAAAVPAGLGADRRVRAADLRHLPRRLDRRGREHLPRPCRPAEPRPCPARGADRHCGAVRLPVAGEPGHCRALDGATEDRHRRCARAAGGRYSGRAWRSRRL